MTIIYVNAASNNLIYFNCSISTKPFCFYYKYLYFIVLMHIKYHYFFKT